MPYIHQRTIQFRDTDAAGVVYFANVLSLCHEAYEASLAAANIDLRSFFGGATIAIPITQASVNFFKPMFCGDRLQIHLTPSAISAEKFSIAYQIFAADSLEKRLATAVTEHVCIDAITRRKQALAPEMQQWLQQWHEAN